MTAAAAAHGKLPINAATRPDPESFEDQNHDSRGAGEALSRLAKDLPFMGPLKQGLGLFLIQAYSPILKPFEVLNVLTNHMFSRLAPGLADKFYELLYKIIPTGIISKAAGKIGLGGGIFNQVAKFLISSLAKAGIKTSDENIKVLTNELGKGLSDMYNPQFLKQFDNFFTRALREGERPYMEVADALIEKALANVGDTVTKALSQGVNAIENSTAQVAVTEAITETAKKERVKQKADATTPKIQNTQNLTTQKPTPDKKVQSPDNSPKPGFLANVLSSISNIPSKITGIFSPKPAPAAA